MSDPVVITPATETIDPAVVVLGGGEAALCLLLLLLCLSLRGEL